MENRNYYLGLDIGTDSVGYAVTNENYKLMKYKGCAMWGTHVFDAAALCDDRRGYRTARRRLDRRQHRVMLLQELFAKEIAKVDAEFYKRIQCSALLAEDSPYPKGLFVGPELTDKTYHHAYPTIHHLIMELINDPATHDVRLVYLACAWIVAHRGHFLSEVSKDNIGQITDFDGAYRNFMALFEEERPWGDVASAVVGEILEKGKNITVRKKELQKALFPKGKIEESEEFPYSRKALIALLAGGQCKAADLYPGKTLEKAESVSVNMEEEKWQAIIEELGDDAELLIRVKAMVDCISLKKLLGDEQYISVCKIKTYEQHKQDLKSLKSLIKKYCPEKYKEVFSIPGKCNYVAYSKNFRKVKKTVKEYKGASQEEFCKYIKGIVGEIKAEKEDQAAYEDMLQRLQDNTFMPKQVSGENRLIPYQLYWVELKAVLENAKAYLPFLSETDEDGLSVYDKIMSVFEFRIPYFVGPLGRRGENVWLKRKAEGKILPWSFDKLVDQDASEDAFIRRMTNKCTYLPEEDVLPKASLLYQRFEVLNELNNVKLNGADIPVSAKQMLYTELFLKEKKRVTKKRILDALMSCGLAEKEDVVSGIDDSMKSSLSAYHGFKRLLESGALKERDVEQIILRSTVTEDRFRFRKWLGSNYPALSERDVTYVGTIKCKDFGRLSKAFLDGGILHGDRETGEAVSVIEMMWRTNENLMQLLSDRFDFGAQVEEAQREFYNENKLKLNDRFDMLYVSNAVRRPIFRAMDIIRDVVKSQRGVPPKKIFIEMARGGEPGKQKVRTKSRYDQLMELYTGIEEDTRALQEQLTAMGEEVNSRLQSEKLFLYYLQLGKSAYSGTPISLSDLNDDSRTNVDHIYPQAKVADDSILNNKVLCFSEENGAKSDTYPVPQEWRSRMFYFWTYLKENGLMTEEKFKRLTRATPFTDEEKWGFINRQLVETRQSTKVLAMLLKEKYRDSEVVYVKAGLVSDFRREYTFVKSRSVNDLHHAKDAYLNIVVGNVYSAKFTKQWFLSHRDTYSLNLRATFGKKNEETGEWTGTKYFSDAEIRTVCAAMAKNNIHYTAFSYCKHGGFYKQMPVTAAAVRASGDNARFAPRKKGLPPEKYGGYSDLAPAFYVLAKFAQDGKHELMLVPVELMYAGCFERLDRALAYTREQAEFITGKTVEDLSLPLGCRKIKIKTVFEVDGFRFCLNGKDSGGKRIVVSPLNALVLSPEDERYVKRLERFCEKRKTNPKLTYSAQYDGIDAEGNRALYQKLVDKIDAFYFKRPAIQIEKIKEGANTFEKLEIDRQAASLLSLLSFFGRSAAKSTDVDLGSGACYLNARISAWAAKYKTAHIVDTSASGIYEKKSENLLEMVQ